MGQPRSMAEPVVVSHRATSKDLPTKPCTFNLAPDHQGPYRRPCPMKRHVLHGLVGLRPRLPAPRSRFAPASAHGPRASHPPASPPPHDDALIGVVGAARWNGPRPGTSRPRPAGIEPNAWSPDARASSASSTQRRRCRQSDSVSPGRPMLGPLRPACACLRARHWSRSCCGQRVGGVAAQLDHKLVASRGSPSG